MRGCKSHQGVPPLLQLFLTPVPHSARLESSCSPPVLRAKGFCNLHKKKGASPAHSALAHELGVSGGLTYNALLEGIR